MERSYRYRKAHESRENPLYTDVAELFKETLLSHVVPVVEKNEWESVFEQSYLTERREAELKHVHYHRDNETEYEYQSGCMAEPDVLVLLVRFKKHKDCHEGHSHNQLRNVS